MNARYTLAAAQLMFLLEFADNIIRTLELISPGLLVGEAERCHALRRRLLRLPIVVENIDIIDLMTIANGSNISAVMGEALRLFSGM
jgi:hypothetical protein